jgi:hypothetical protein
MIAVIAEAIAQVAEVIAQVAERSHRLQSDRTGCRAIAQVAERSHRLQSDRTGDTHTLCITTHTSQDGLLIWTHERHWTIPVKVESRFFLMFLDGGNNLKVSQKF